MTACGMRPRSQNLGKLSKLEGGGGRRELMANNVSGCPRDRNHISADVAVLDCCPFALYIYLSAPESLLVATESLINQTPAKIW